MGSGPDYEPSPIAAHRLVSLPCAKGGGPPNGGGGIVEIVKTSICAGPTSPKVNVEADEVVAERRLPCVKGAVSRKAD